jgi:hypothetical protein
VAADEAVLNNVHKKKKSKKSPFSNLWDHEDLIYRKMGVKNLMIVHLYNNAFRVSSWCWKEETIKNGSKTA